MAGALHELFKHVLVHDFPELDITQAKVVLLEATDHLLAPFHPSSRQHALHILNKRGVEVRLGQALEQATPDEVRLKDGTVIPTRTLVWGAGCGPTRWPTCSASSRPAGAGSWSAMT